MKVAIIGAGPRGLWAAQELTQQLAQQEKQSKVQSTVQHKIVLFDPYSPGSGAVYRTDQPRAWRLNVRSDVVVTGSESLNEWRIHRGEQPPLDPFPPRALVGEYLEDCWAELVEEVAGLADISIEHRPRRVESVQSAVTKPATRNTERFRVDGEAFDAVLVTTGHPHDHPGALIHESRAKDAPVVMQLYWGDEQGMELPASPRVIGVRGAALSFIDLCLFYSDSNATRPIILPVNRGGRFMEVKPDPSLPVPDFSDYEAKVHAATTTTELEEVLVEAAASLIDANSVTADNAVAEVTENDLRAVLEGTDFTGDAVAELRASLAVAEGRLPHTAASAIGMAFRELYQQIVDDMVERGGPLPGFFDLARRLERVAFGPPPATAKTLLALIDDGTVRTDFLGQPAALEEWLAGHAYEGVLPDVIVDATIAPQGMSHPFADLDGEPGFYASGRMNERTVVGHDSLKRTIYRDIPRWAERTAKNGN